MCLKRIAYRSLLPLLAITVLNACVASNFNIPSNFVGTPIAASTMAPAPLPTYRAGDKFYFSNKSSYKVENVGGGTVQWINHRKRKSTTTPDPMAPEIYLETKSREYNKRTSPSAGNLWPLMVGKQSKFSTISSFQSKAGLKNGTFKQLWNCGVDSAERVRVLAGTFNSYRVSCKRMSVSLQSGRQRYRQTLVYHYAPEIGHIVRRESRAKGKPSKVRELVAIRPDISFLADADAKNIRRTFQSALENNQSGQPAKWGNGKIGTIITPVQTFQAANGKFCRNYTQVLNQGDGDRFYAGVACREDKLKWLTPTK